MNYKMFVRINVITYKRICYSIPFLNLFNGIILTNFITDFRFLFFFFMYAVKIFA